MRSIASGNKKTLGYAPVAFEARLMDVFVHQFESKTFDHSFGVRPLSSSSDFTEVTPSYRDEIRLRRNLSSTDPSNYFAADARSPEAQNEAASFIVENAPHISESNGSYLNELTGETIDIDPVRPLWSIGMHVQEDLVICSGDLASGFSVIAGHVCFPSGWSIADKLGQSMLHVHAPVPEFSAKLAALTTKLLQRMKSGRPVWRTNWGVRPLDRLDQSPKHLSEISKAARMVTHRNALARCYFRTERQTMIRLPESKDILFAIHTHQLPLAELEMTMRNTLASIIETCPEETLKYKGILPMRDAVVVALRSIENPPC